MKQFMDSEFLLDTETAQKLYHEYAEKLPIIDYHCHISPQEIYEDRRFDNLAQVWLGGKQTDGSYFGDHYKWRMMRSNGVPEEEITGSTEDALRIERFAQALELAIGNPMYHWCNLELQRFFGWAKPLNRTNAREAYHFCTDKLQNDPDMTVRGLIRKANVKFIGTTDDPVDSLFWHKKLHEDPTIDFIVCPSFRPDKAINISKPGFTDYLLRLAASVGKETLCTVADVCDALTQRLEFFAANGCRASDHGLDYIPYRSCTQKQADDALQKVLVGNVLTLEEAENYQTFVLLHLCREYHRLGIVLQLHYSCTRNVNQRMFACMGPDTGFDMIGQASCGDAIAALLSHLEMEGKCPKTILYSLNPIDNAQIGTLLGCFQATDVPGKIQHGSAWWFNDTKDGMEAQMKSLAQLGILGNFVGMLTDSRSFLSYPRHEYFRRIMCNLIGNWVENGEYPDDEQVLKTIVEGICYNNAARYFGIE